MATKAERTLLPDNVVPTHYSIVLTPDLETLTFTCEEQVDVQISVPTNTIMMHSKEITIKSASFEIDGKVIGELEQISYHLKDTTVTLTFKEELPICDRGTLKIAYSGILNGDMAGFYKSNYTDADGNKKVMASTQFEALDARRAFPCWDEPGIKATFAVTLVVPNHITALSNMPEKMVEAIKGGKKKVEFQTSPKMSTYLLAWAVGEFDCVRAVTKHGVNIAIYSPPGRASQGNFALDCGIKALDFYDDFFGLPYPLPKLDMLCVTEFAMGAMENWGLVTYREVDLMIDPDKASSQQKQRVAIVVTHELAHQWFGNLVTMDWWDDLWLNEGFAAWSEHFATDHIFPEWNIWDQYTTDAMSAALRLDSLKSSHPIQVPIKRAEEVEEIFDAISYCKGSTVVRMASAILGKNKFREGLQNYMAKFQYKNTVTSDLWQAWSDVSGMDFAAIMNSWTKQMGYPYLKVVSESWTATSVEFKLEQAWFLADGSAPSKEEEGKLWTIPMLFATSSHVSETAVLMKSKTQSFSIPLVNANDWLKINAGQQALVRVAYTPEMTKRLVVAIRECSLSTVDRAAVLLDAYALAKAGAAPIETVVELLKAYDNEVNSVVWDAISGVLTGLNSLMEVVGGTCYASFTKFASNIVKSAFQKVGWEAKSTDGHQEKLLRSTIIGLLDVFCADDASVVNEARMKFDAHWTDDSALSSDYKSTVYKLVLKNSKDSSAYESILKTFYDTEDNAIKKYAFSIGATPDKDLKLRTLDWCVKSGDVKLQDFFYPIGGVASGHGGNELAWEYFKGNFAFIKEKLSKASPSLMDAVIIHSCRFVTNDKADEIEAFFKANPLPQSARRISQVLESMRTNGSFLKIVQASKLADSSFWA